MRTFFRNFTREDAHHDYIHVQNLMFFYSTPNGCPSGGVDVAERVLDAAVQVNTATAMHRLAVAVTHSALSPAVRSELQYNDLVQRLLVTAKGQVR